VGTKAAAAWAEARAVAATEGVARAEAARAEGTEEGMGDAQEREGGVW